MLRVRRFAAAVGLIGLWNIVGQIIFLIASKLILRVKCVKDVNQSIIQLIDFIDRSINQSV